jgi:hypothetical protein
MVNEEGVSASLEQYKKNSMFIRIMPFNSTKEFSESPLQSQRVIDIFIEWTCRIFSIPQLIEAKLNLAAEIPELKIFHIVHAIW